MLKRHAALFAAAAVLAVGALWAGGPAGTVLLVVAFLACPMMMLLMTRSMSGHGDMGAGIAPARTDDLERQDGGRSS